MPIRSAVTVSLVPEARGGPFVFWDDLPAACRQAKALGFDAIELFPPGPDAVDPTTLQKLLNDNGLALAAVGTGAGWVKHKLTLTSPDDDVRRKAIQFIESMIDFAASFNAMPIIGSMQGRWGDGVGRDTALNHLANALVLLGEYASKRGVRLLYEPLNRYETNLINRLDDAVELLRKTGCDNVKLLADLFHMNIEETNFAASLRAAGPLIGHVHLADSNRHAAGLGHTDFVPIATALREIGYTSYLSAEVFPLPTSEDAARQTMIAFRRYFA